MNVKVKVISTHDCIQVSQIANFVNLTDMYNITTQDSVD